jgi:hypothetical protein
MTNTQINDKRLKKLETKSIENKKPEVVFNPDGSLRIKRRRNRKCPKQMEYLLTCLRNDPDWTKETCQRVSDETGLSVVQVYKWGWDQKKKDEADGVDMIEEIKAPSVTQETRKRHNVSKN